MDLLTTEAPATKTYTGSATFAVAARKECNIRYKVAGEWVDVLNGEVPAGKAWTVSVSVNIQETDA